MQGHIRTRRRRRRRRLRFLSLDFQKRAWSRKGKIHGLTHFNHFCGEKHRGGNTFGRSWLCKMRGVQVCQRLLPARKKNAPGLCWAGHRAPFLHRENVFVNIHPTHEARAASSSSCRCKSLYININASSACTTYSCPLHSQLVLRIAESAESSTEFTAPQP